MPHQEVLRLAGTVGGHVPEVVIVVGGSDGPHHGLLYPFKQQWILRALFKQQNSPYPPLWQQSG